eukprot:m51a1_g14003 putative C-tail anchored protein (95) ;mRNA; r:1070079-1070787
MEMSLRKVELEVRVCLFKLEVEKIRAMKEAVAEAPKKPLVYLTTFLLSKGYQAGTAGKLEVEFYQDVHNLTNRSLRMMLVIVSGLLIMALLMGL